MPKEGHARFEEFLYFHLTLYGAAAPLGPLLNFLLFCRFSRIFAVVIASRAPKIEYFLSDMDAAAALQQQLRMATAILQMQHAANIAVPPALPPTLALTPPNENSPPHDARVRCCFYLLLPSVLGSCRIECAIRVAVI